MATTATMAALEREVAPARTFAFEADIAALQAAGLARGGTLDNAVVFRDVRDRGEGGGRGQGGAGGAAAGMALNDGGLRFEDEWVRHKALDCIGDLALAGLPLHAQFFGVRCGHELNHSLLETLFGDERNFVLR